MNLASKPKVEPWVLPFATLRSPSPVGRWTVSTELQKAEGREAGLMTLTVEGQREGGGLYAERESDCRLTPNGFQNAKARLVWKGGRVFSSYVNMPKEIV